MEEVGREAQYEGFAGQFERHAEDGFHNAHYDRPACLELLGDVAGQHVLDAACGPGLYAEELLRRGARVTGFDQSSAMVRLSRARAPQGEFRVHDAADPLTWLPSGSVDSVLLALALEHLDDRVSALRELHRVLRPWGALVLSRMHPTGDWLRHGGSYFDVRVVEEVWHESWPVRYWLAPLERTCEELHQAGFLVERLTEPRPAPSAEGLRPEDYQRLHREPRGFLAIRALARPGPGAGPG
jgi:SAM-dependent methyltransferase